MRKLAPLQARTLACVAQRSSLPKPRLAMPVGDHPMCKVAVFQGSQPQRGHLIRSSGLYVTGMRGN